MEIKDEASRIDSPDKDIKISPPLTENAGFDFSKYSISEKIGIFGIGGAGCNIIDFIYKKFKFDNYVSLYAVNTDAQSLQRTDSNISRIILGKKFLLGRGSGGNPDIGANAVSENVDEFKEIFKKLDFIFLIAGLGKGTGSGSTGEIAKIAKEMNKLVVCYLTKPSFEFDGEESYNNSCKYSNYIYSIANSSNIILNSRVLQLNGELIDFTGGYEIINDLIGCSIKLLVDIINKPAKINLDFNDISNFFKKNNKFNILSFEIPNEWNQTIINDLILDAYKNRISDISFTNKFVNLIVYYSCNKPISINCNKYIVSGVANILKIETSKINLVYSLYNDSDSDNTINIIYSGNEGNEDNIKIDNNILDDNVFDMITNSNKIQLTKKEWEFDDGNCGLDTNSTKHITNALKKTMSIDPNSDFDEDKYKS